MLMGTSFTAAELDALGSLGLLPFEAVRPTALIGAAGQPSTFIPAVLQAMARITALPEPTDLLNHIKSKLYDPTYQEYV